MVLIVMMWGLYIQPDDKELFMGLNTSQTLVKPNVVILMDSSISMNYVLFYPRKGLDGIAGTEDDGYDPNEEYSGTIDYNPVYALSAPTLMARWRTPQGNATLFKNTEVGNNWTGCYASDGSGSKFQVGSNGTNYFNVGERIMYIDWSYNPPKIAVATIESKETISGNTWFKLKDIQGNKIVANSVLNGTIKGHFQRPMSANHLLVDLVLYGYRDLRGTGYQDALYLPEYLTWVYCHATVKQLDAIRNFFKYGIFVYTENLTTEIINNPTSWSICDKNNYQRVKQLWTRIQVAREVMCWLARTHNKTVKLSLFDFAEPDKDLDPPGANEVENLGDMSDEVSLIDFLGKIWAVKATSYTPLAEALADVWYDYKPGPSSKTYWPVDVELDKGTTSVNNAVSDILWWCQNNYVVIMTDGESTKDTFANSKYTGSIFKSKSTDTIYSPVKRQDVWENWTDGWGDPDNTDPLPTNYNPDTATYCPNDTCWDRNLNGTDYLDDVAYFLAHQDMFPDDDNKSNYFRTTRVDPTNLTEKIWPGDQKIYTYAIGFNVNNHLLQQTAINGDGGYYTADSYEELKQAFQDVITSINLRNYAFSSITAPKKTATATNADLTVSYVGYFMPSQAAPIWEGHLMAFPLVDLWGFDTDDPPDQMDPQEYVYDTQEECLNASGGRECYRWMTLDISQLWDAADPSRMPTDRNLYTHDYGSASPTSLIEFSLTNETVLRPLFGTAVTEEQAQQIIDKIRLPQLGDIFHSDVGFVGTPPYGKQFVSNLNPTGPGDETYATFYDTYKTDEKNGIYGRDRVIYTGTNDGILHMFYADAPPLSGRADTTAGQEVWGFIPDEVLPSLTQIVLGGQHTYTVDGRLSVNDIYYVKSGDSSNTWSTILVFGLRAGGRSYYCLDITTAGNQPTLLWKFNDANHSGQSWGKASIARIKIQDPDNPSEIIDKWAAVLPGGFGFNSKNPTDTRGKAIFVVDASNGDLIWKIAYTTPVGDPDQPDISGFLSDSSTDDDKFLTTADVFNYSIPTGMLAVDKDNNGYLDTIYFGNLGGHFFKANISDVNPGNWTAQLIFEDKYIPKKGPAKIKSISGSEFTLDGKPFAIGDGIMGQTSYATGYIINIANMVITVSTTSGTFQANENIVSYDYDPIYLAPAAAYDTCYNLWVSFGTGDRDRPRTNPRTGRYLVFRDTGALNFIEDASGNISSSTLAKFTWGGTGNKDLIGPNPIPADANGFYYNFPDTGEKLFDPEPIILPDEKLVPHFYSNTYQPPVTSISKKEDPCDIPQEGIMKIYDIALKSCGTLDDITGGRETGRIAGGGIYEGKEYVMYTSKSGDVADVPGGEGGQFSADPKRLPYPGGLVFWKEKKR